MCRGDDTKFMDGSGMSTTECEFDEPIIYQKNCVGSEYLVDLLNDASGASPVQYDDGYINVYIS